jgi:hypothetical protein
LQDGKWVMYESTTTLKGIHGDLYLILCDGGDNVGRIVASVAVGVML